MPSRLSGPLHPGLGIRLAPRASDDRALLPGQPPAVNGARGGFALPRPDPGAAGGWPADPAPPLAAPESLPDDATIDLAAERKVAAVDEVLDCLDRDLVGLVPVKTRIREIAALLL